jgi:hypothetical protein
MTREITALALRKRADYREQGDDSSSHHFSFHGVVRRHWWLQWFLVWQTLPRAFRDPSVFSE